MNFNQADFLPIVLVAIVLLSLVVIILEKKFFRFIKTYWFYGRSWLSYLASFLFILGMSGLLISLLDIRGPEEKIKTEVPEDRTIILMDTSASMLAEDVKPSRLQKAALIAKHFARKAAGHQISVVAFAEVQKKIVPFTNDLDLIDARLDSIESLRNQYGSSALSLAIQESIQYFRETGGETRGNILVLTDGEETAEGIDLKIPKNVHVALVGIGTENGGRIPLDDGRGFRFGYKKDRGRDVITKLNEKFFKEVTADIPSSKYWIANSYTLPTEEILNFFQGEKVKSNTQQDMVIKPVLMEWVVIPSVIFLVLSYVLKSIRIFSLGLLLLITPVKAQDAEIELAPETILKMDQLSRGELNQLEKVKLADELHKAGAKDEALALYQENLPAEIDPEIPSEAYLNYGTALLEKGEVEKGLSLYKKLSDQLGDSPAAERVKDTIDKNTVTYFRKEKQKKEQQKNQKNQQGDNKDQKNNQSGENQQNNQQSGSGNQQEKKNQKGSEDQKNKQDKGEGKDKKDQKGENSDQDEQDKDNEEKNKNSESGENRLPRRKIPAKLKQLMSDDRQLQMKMIENGTRDLNRRKSRKSKDW